jgi:hypothetical protein
MLENDLVWDFAVVQNTLDERQHAPLLLTSDWCTP